MVEIAISVAAKIAEYLVAPVARPVSYLWNYKTNLEKLKNGVKKLEARRDTVKSLIEVVGGAALPNVKFWQDEIEKIINEASELINEDNPEQANTQCCKGFSSSNLWKRYQRSKNAAGKLKDVDELQQEGERFRVVAHPTIPKPAFLQSSEDYEAFESRKSILNEIMDALRNPDVNMVGIYGMGGVGKTMLAEEVGRKAHGDKLFHNIVLVEVSELSQQPEKKDIQRGIAANFNLELTDGDIRARTTKLYNELKKKEKSLLILDNLWGSIDFKGVGIPFAKDHKGLKLLLTTRSEDLLTQMGSKHNFKIETLEEEEALSFFKSKAGMSVEKPDLQSIATEVASKCGGTPFAIVTVAKTLIKKGPNEWENALGKLKKFSLDSYDELNKCIKLSYDYLDTEKERQIFLLCSCMGRTYDASIQDLFRYGFGLGLFDKINTMEQTLCNVYVFVNKLKANHLLLGAPDSEKFTMHDVVCGFARSIESRDQRVLIGTDDVISRLWACELSKHTSITLHNIDEIPADLQLECPEPKFLYMKPKKSYSRILDNFFARMSKLQVLHLVAIDLQALPTSLKCLENLQALCLDECELGDMAVIGGLKKLEILSFCGSDIEKLPEQMRCLTRLRLLDLTDCYNLRVIPSNVMSNLTKLEALYMCYTSIQWEVERPNIERSNISIDELKHLHYLTILEMHIPDPKMANGLIFQRLKRYKIFIGHKWEGQHWERHSLTYRMLKLSLDTNEDGIISQLKGIEELELGEVPGATYLLDALDRNGFPTLKHLNVKSSSHCSGIVESCDALPSLQSLILKSLDNMEKICNSPLGANTFLQLRTIRVDNCPKLNNIFSFSMVTVLLQLEEIEVSNCKNMEEIFAIGGQDDSNNTEVVNEIKFSQLRIMGLSNLQRLKSFCCKVKPASALQLTRDSGQPREIISGDEIDVLTSLFNDKVASPNLQTLRISDIHVEKIWHNLPSKVSSCVQNLTELSIYGCGNLKELFSSSTIVTEESREKEMRDTILFPKLNYLWIENLEKLTTLWSGYYIEFPTLKKFIIRSCPQLDAFIFDDKVAFPNLQTLDISDIHVEKIWHSLPPKISSCVQNLTRLSISGCGNLKELFSSSTVVTEKSRDEEMRDTILFPKLNHLHMNGLEKLTTLWSGYYIEFPTLKEFSIQRCPQLDAFIFDDKVRVPSLEKMEISIMDNLKMMWHNQLDGDSIPKLKSLQVYHCRKLLTVFDLQGIISEERNSIAATQSRDLCFSNLQELHVSGCQSLKYLFAASNNVANDEYSPKFLFPKLTSLVLWILPELRSFYPGRHTVEGPVLKSLELYDCFIQMQQPLFFVEQAFPCSEKLRLARKNVMMMWHGQVPESLFVKLKILEVSDDDSTVLPLCIIQRFQNLEKLAISSCSYKEIFSNREDQTQAPTPARIKTLHLHNLKDLKYMWKHDFKQLDLILQNLEVLNIYWCNSLINVMPPSASFQNLTVMEVERCSSLINIGTSSAAKSLVQLTQMRIKECKNIIEVVGNHGDVTEDEIIFPKLKSLSLRDLPSLTCFCSLKVTLQFPSLEELFVIECPQMKIFSRGVLTTQTLRKFKIDKESIELCPDVDINKAIQQFHENMKSQSSIKEFEDYDPEDYSDSFN